MEGTFPEDPNEYKPLPEQSKQSKWRKLEKKYLQYIELLKKKLEHTQRKLSSTDQTRLSIMSSLPQRTGSPLCFEVITKFERIRVRHLSSAFEKLRARQELERELRASKDLELTSGGKMVGMNTVRALLLLREAELAKLLDLRGAFGRIKGFWGEEFDGRVFDVVEYRMRLLKSEAFVKIRLNHKANQPSIPVLTKCLLQLQQSFRSLPVLQPNPTLLPIPHPLSQLTRLSIKSCTLSTCVSKLQHQLKKVNQQRALETSKKQKGLKQLAQQMSQKDQLIAQLQHQIQLLRESTPASKLKPIDYQLQLNRQNSTIMKLQTQLKQQAETYQHMINKTRNSETALQAQVRELQEDLVEAESKLEELGYGKEEVDENRKELEEIRARLKEEQGKLVDREQRCAKAEHLVVRIETVLRSRGALIEDQEQTAKHKLEKIQTLLINLHDHTHQSPTKRNPHDILDIVEQIIESQQPIKYNRLYTFGGMAEDLNRIQDKIFRIKKNINLTKQQQVNGVKQRRRRWLAPQASNSQSQHPQSCQALTTRGNRSNPQLTGRLIQLQMQKNKCQQLVLQLKQKALMVRKVVHEFVKSLNIKSITKQADYTLGVLLDVFQYSEDEKEQMLSGLKKKAGFFGLFQRN